MRILGVSAAAMLLSGCVAMDVQDIQVNTSPEVSHFAGWLTPNFYFHLVTAYDILRAKGLAIGKADYLSHLRPLLAAAMAS